MMNSYYIKEKMNFKSWLWFSGSIAVLIIIIVFFGFLIFGVFNDNFSNSNNAKVNQVLSELDVYEVAITNVGYVPPELTIKQGEIVIWKVQDYSFHKIISQDGTSIQSERMYKDQNYTKAFNEKGVYEYNCAYHPYIKGKITVE